MSTDNKPTNEPEVKEVQTEVPADTKEEQEQTIGEVLQDDNDKSDADTSATLSPEQINKLLNQSKVFEATNKANRDLRKKLKDLESKIESGDITQEEVSDDIESIADEFQVDKRFLSKVEKAMENKLTKELENRISEKLKPFEERESLVKAKSKFETYLKASLERMPEYEKVIDRSTLFERFNLPSNANKTMSQLIEETYGNALGSGRPSIETTTPRGGKEPEGVDFSRAVKDPAYFSEIMKDQDLKKKYNDGLAQRILR